MVEKIKTWKRKCLLLICLFNCKEYLACMDDVESWMKRNECHGIEQFLSPCRLMSCWVWEEQKASAGQSLISHQGTANQDVPSSPRCLLEWAFGLWPLFASRLSNLSVEDWMGKEKTKNAYTESDASEQLELLGHENLWEKNLTKMGEMYSSVARIRLFPSGKKQSSKHS